MFVAVLHDPAFDVWVELWVWRTKMARTMQLLSALEVKRITRPDMHHVGAGLYLQVRGSCARSWIYRYRLNGKTRWAGLGSERDVSLGDARRKVDDIRANVKAGNDPVADRKQQKIPREKEKCQRTFQRCTESYLTDHDKNWRNAKHRQQWRNTLEQYAIPAIGSLPTTEITASHILEIMRPIWLDKNETARRVRGRIEKVLDYAADPDDLSYINPACWTKQLRRSLPKLPQEKRPKNHPSLPHQEIGAFMALLRQREGTAARALEFAILTAARTGEALGGKWSEIDMLASKWTVPAERMKGKRVHRVPLSAAVLDIFRRMQDRKCGDYVFPSAEERRPLSNMALLAVLHRMGRRDVTVHGFRASFRSWAGHVKAEETDVLEAALAHVEKDETKKAYARDDYYERRIAVMSKWGDYCALVGQGDVIPLLLRPAG
jgi:integrase